MLVSSMGLLFLHKDTGESAVLWSHRINCDGQQAGSDHYGNLLRLKWRVKMQHSHTKTTDCVTTDIRRRVVNEVHKYLKHTTADLKHKRQLHGANSDTQLAISFIQNDTNIATGWHCYTAVILIDSVAIYLSACLSANLTICIRLQIFTATKCQPTA